MAKQSCNAHSYPCEQVLLPRQDKTALHHAAMNGKADAIDALIKAGAYMNAKDSGGKTALHIAAINEKADVIAALLRAGAAMDGADYHFTELLCQQNQNRNAGGKNDIALKAAIEGIFLNPYAQDAMSLVDLNSIHTNMIWFAL